MPNTISRKIINIVDNSINLDADLFINYVIARASADSPDCVLTDKHGNKFFDWTTAVANERVWGLPLNGQKIEGLRVDTWANMTRVIIGLVK